MTREAVRVAALLFFSGLSALVYQTVWMRQFRLIFGASTLATGAVLAIFMAGLGLGSALLGKKADQTDRPLAWYARLELWIAAAAALSQPLLFVAAKLYFASGGLSVLRILIAIVVLGPATFLMGGTLPAAARAVETNDDQGRRTVALLYGVNTFGAVAGTLLSTFVMLERFGNRATLFAAVGVNVLVALVALRLGGAANSVAPIEQPGDEAGALKPAAPLVPCLLFSFLTGFVFLLMELVWYRMLSPILGGTTYMFGLVLAVALAGIGIGGALYAVFRRGTPTLRAFAITSTLEALAIAIPFALGDRIAILAASLRSLGALGFDGHIVAWTIVTSIVVLPAAILAGIQFPLLIALLGRGRDDVGAQIGSVYAWNTAGAIAGAIAGGFGLLPLLSAPGAWRLAIALLAVAGLIAARSHLTFLIAGLAILCSTALGPTAVWRHSGIGAARAAVPDRRNELQRWINDERRTVVWERDGRESSVALVAITDLSFIVNGKSDGAAREDAGTQVMSGMIAALLHSNPSEALVVGLGTGSSAGWLGAIPAMRRVDVVELEPVVLEVARACGAVNAGVLTNPKVHIAIGDAREVLLTSRHQYDLIVSEPSNPYRAGIASLFTREFYLAARERLRPGGIFAQWVQSYAVHPDTMRTVYATLTSVFPHVQTWWTTAGDLMLIASARPLAVDMDVLRTRIAAEPYQSALRNAFRRTTAEGFIAHLTASEDFARAAAAQAPALNTDDHTVIEFGFARSIDARASLHAQIASEAQQRGTSRPLHVRGTVDWEEVEAQRPWKTVGGAMHQIESDVLLAQAHAKDQQLDAATEMLRRAFIAYRANPWPDPQTMRDALELALDVAKSSPQRARRLDEALAKPFAALQHENTRRFARIAITPLYDECGARTIEALGAAEPHPMWNRHVLTIRANCYALAKSPLSDQAWKDLARYEAAERTTVVRPE
jgi:spermidine synthase